MHSKLMETSSGDRSIGVQAVYDALSAPLRQISENAGEEPSVVARKFWRTNQKVSDITLGTRNT